MCERGAGSGRAGMRLVSHKQCERAPRGLLAVVRRGLGPLSLLELLGEIGQALGQILVAEGARVFDTGRSLDGLVRRPAARCRAGGGGSGVVEVDDLRANPTVRRNLDPIDHTATELGIDLPFLAVEGKELGQAAAGLVEAVVGP